MSREEDKEIISRLKFIGKLQKGDKINVRFMFVQADGFFTQLSRTFVNKDNRGNTLMFVQKTILTIFEILSQYEKSNKQSDKIMIHNIIYDLKNAKSGLMNLKETYISDIKFCCDIDTFLQMIESKLSEIDIYEVDQNE